VYDYLGIARESRKDLSRDQRDEIVEEEFKKLKRLGVQLTVQNGPQGIPEELGLQSIWDLTYHAWGPKRTKDPDRFLDRKEWRLLVRPNAWAQLYLNGEKGARQFGYFSRELIESIDWHNNPAAGDLAIELLKYARFNDGKPRDLKVERMLEICQLTSPNGKVETNRYRERLERAILQQRRWGWEIEWDRWPVQYRPYKENRPDFPKKYWLGESKDEWEKHFHEWKVTFNPGEDLAELNRITERQSSREPEGALPGGWAARIKAILDQTDNTQKDLADKLEVAPSTITRWKNGSRAPAKGGDKAKLRDIERRAGLRSD
jgi:DNA-binding Xre family transcriptional regulator